MWRHYMTTTLRVLTRNKVYSFVNLSGLAVGFAACLIILLYVRYELSYDAWLPDADRTFQLQSEYPGAEPGERLRLQMAPYAAVPALKKDFPQIERIVYALSARPTVLKDGQAFATRDVLLVDGPFLDVLGFPLIRGDARTALAQVGSVILTQTEARRLFGTEDVLGRTLTLAEDSRVTDYRVTGVAKDLPRNTHVRFSFVARFDPASAFADQPEWLGAWGMHSGWVYATLRSGADAAAVQRALPAWEKRNIPDQKAGDSTYNPGDQQDWRLVNVSDVHLGGARDGMTEGQDVGSLRTLGTVAALILLIASVNFINLSTARATRRAREVGVRKVVGASRAQLLVQFLGETMLMALGAMVVAAALVELTLPLFSSFIEADLALTYFGPGGSLAPMAALVLLLGLAGGAYPAFYLSRFRPSQVLRANQQVHETNRGMSLRTALVVIQFSIAIGLMTCTAVIYAQTVHARSADPGYRRDGLLQVEALPQRLLPAADALVREMRKVPGVSAVGRSGIGVATTKTSFTAVNVPGRGAPVNVGTYGVDSSFFETAGVRLLAGRLFEEARAADDSTAPLQPDAGFDRSLAARGVHVVINEKAARALGFTTPSAAVGQQLHSALVDGELGLVPTTIIGVVGDTRFRSVRDPIEPLMFRLDRSAADTILIRYRDAAGVRDRIEAAWRRLAPDEPFQAEFSEEIVSALYSGESAEAETFGAFAALAIGIASLGLFALAAFAADRRTKEIGIRKVFGARVSDIVQLLSWQFSRPVIAANLVAWPVAWWAMRDWLNGFDSRIGLGPGPFLLAGLLALAIAIGTVAGHALRVARMNPIHALRYE
jgi:putative ABC transport system permease protein